MSTIAGIVRHIGEAVTPFDLAAAAKRMVEPGLLEAQYWTQDGTGFAVRQSLVTHEDLMERQPWVSADGRLVLVLDGRIDNREELGAALGISLQAETVPDGWLLLQALERWGEAAPARLVGDFVFALWDTQRRCLLLVRDQMGTRSLYYYRGHGFLAFANTFPALLALPGVPKTVDELGIADFLILNMHHPENTFYENVRRMPKSSIAAFDRKGLSFSTYWTPNPAKRLRLSSDSEYVEAAREQLERAVACRLRAKDPIASHISGGLDSSAVATTAARLLAPNRLFAVCSVPPEGMELPPPAPAWYNDERPYLREIAALHPNLDIHLASSSEPHWIEKDPSAFFEAGGMPARNITNIGWFMPGRELAENLGIKVLLTGQAGNAAWSYDGLRSMSDMFRQGRWLRLGREIYLTGKRAPFGYGWKRLLKTEVVRPLLPTALLRWHRRMKQGQAELWSAFSMINPAFASEINLYRRSRDAGYDMICTGSMDSQGVMLSMLNRNEHGKDILTAMRSLGGIESRDPLLDRRLVEFFLSIPQDQYLKDGIARRLARKALSDRLPPSVLEKERIGMQNPEILSRLDKLREDMGGEIAGLAEIPLVARCIDLPRLEKTVSDWPKQGPAVTLALPRALNVARFLRWVEQSDF
ncbi:asparagine synthase-related protein [Methylomonas fluvii]|uniref:asparagine synthase (glutamine-hydrolyzing) n=1 Tax=Methylomonas fluvii TaxID=1854564 RepID=A0ABR9DHW2_9GAMM|nr:asparagine synthase-related protein [Methylomonas fluvii]MBD9362466.1 hypothetical protein [Methylomonas fluvii]